MSSLLDNLPSVIPRAELRLDDVQSVSERGDDRPIIIVHSREVEVHEKDLLRSYGVVLEWAESFQNIPLAKLKFDFLLVSVHSKDGRLLLQKNPLDAYQVVILCKKYEMLDDWIDDIQHVNVIRSLPARSPFKHDFCALLTQPKIRQPSCGKAVLRLFLNLWAGCGSK